MFSYIVNNILSSFFIQEECNRSWRWYSIFIKSLWIKKFINFASIWKSKNFNNFNNLNLKFFKKFIIYNKLIDNKEFLTYSMNRVFQQMEESRPWSSLADILRRS